MMRVLFAIYLGCVTALALAKQGDSLDAIEAERATLQAESRKAEAECYDRFAVNACLSEVATQRRTQAAVLRKRELVLRDAQRAERAREQWERLREKQAQALERTFDAQGKSVALPAAPKKAPASAKPAASAPEKTPSISPVQAATNRAAFESKQDEAARHKSDVEKRLQDKKVRAEPLPTTP